MTWLLAQIKHKGPAYPVKHWTSRFSFVMLTALQMDVLSSLPVETFGQHRFAATTSEFNPR
jgi:hypothetical protein